SLRKKYGVVCDTTTTIGKGATAVVRIAHRDRVGDGRLYAIKEFRKRRKDEGEKAYIKKLTSEFCISSILHHENVVETVDLVLDEDHQWCEVMEYCPGGDLYNVIKNGRMTSMEIDCCFAQLIRGVSYLHSLGVAHRDLKPENLLLDAHGRLKITDFGVSDVFRQGWEEDAHASRGFCGSEPYIAPEEFEDHEYDARAVDVWACGIIYYAMAFKGIPFRAASRDDPNYLTFLEKRATGSLSGAFRKLPTGPRVILYKILDPRVDRRITIEGIEKDVWFSSIDVCKDLVGQVSGKPHQHYADGYVPPAMPCRPKGPRKSHSSSSS
ncbi:MAG: kinase-like domain-containing protein, partial [Piptocephalis tieghemiana]